MSAAGVTTGHDARRRSLPGKEIGHESFEIPHNAPVIGADGVAIGAAERIAGRRLKIVSVC
jgi:hypothetical protein